MAKKGEQTIVIPLEVDMDTFIENINTQIAVSEKAIDVLLRQINEYLKMRERVRADNYRYNLKFYFIDNSFNYERTQKKKIGF